MFPPLRDPLETPKREEHARKNQIRQFSVSWNRFSCCGVQTEEPLMIINVWLWMTKEMRRPKISRDTGMHHSITWSCINFSKPQKKWNPKRCVIISNNFQSIHTLYVLSLSPSSSFSDVLISRWTNLYVLCWTRFEDGFVIERRKKQIPTVVKLYSLISWCASLFVL